MAAVIGLGNYRDINPEEDPLGRDWVGYFPRIAEAEAWEQNRGIWKMSRDRVARERFALIVGAGHVRAVAEITGISEYDDRIALEGHLLEAGHPIYDTYMGAPDPAVNRSRNPIAYQELPEEAALRTGPCACGCGETTDRDFLPGHEIRAIMARVRDHFGGNALKFVTWLDDNLAPTRS